MVPRSGKIETEVWERRVGRVFDSAKDYTQGRTVEMVMSSSDSCFTLRMSTAQRPTRRCQPVL